MTPLEIAGKLGAKRTAEGAWIARCPAHEDKRASLSIGTGKAGRVLVHCFAGCTADAIAAAMRIDVRDLFAESEEPTELTYDYRDEKGGLLFQVVRMPGKKFVQRRPTNGVGRFAWDYKLGDVRRVPYRLPQLVADDGTAIVFVPEGEKDCDNLAAKGLLATTNMGGAENWSKVASEARKVLAGRTVVALADNDDPGRKHARDVVESLRGIARAVVLELPGLPEKGDVSDWLSAGHTADELLSLADQALRPDGFVSASERLSGERAERMALVARELSFGVGFLDDALGGILPHDLVLLGARTGAGKTQLASLVAQSNAERGKRVAYFALEAEPREIERRLKYRALVARYFEHGGGSGRVSYQDWYRGRLDSVLGKYEAEAEREIAQRYRTLTTYYRGAAFGLKNLVSLFESLEGQTDLIVLDHLHYVDVEDDETENRGYKAIVKRARDIGLRMGVPVILVAHLKKRDRSVKAILPELDDFHGTSDITKIVTKTIVLAPNLETGPAGALWATYMGTPKYRMDGSVTRYVGLLQFDARKGGYEESYALGLARGEKFEPLDRSALPPWAARAYARETKLNGAADARWSHDP